MRRFLRHAFAVGEYDGVKGFSDQFAGMRFAAFRFRRERFPGRLAFSFVGPALRGRWPN